MLEDLEKDICKKTEEIVKYLGHSGEMYAKGRYEGAPYAGYNDVQTKCDCDGNKAYVSAYGEATLFIEFGTGVLKRSADSEVIQALEHKEELVPHGRYGSQRAMSKDGWFFKLRGPMYNPPSGTEESIKGRNLVHTWGQDAYPIMYEARKHVVEGLPKLAKEIFK